MIKWERVSTYTDRLNIFMGWLVTHCSISVYYDTEGNRRENERIAMCFIFDPLHLWRIKK